MERLLSFKKALRKDQESAKTEIKLFTERFQLHLTGSYLDVDGILG